MHLEHSESLNKAVDKFVSKLFLLNEYDVHASEQRDIVF